MNKQEMKLVAVAALSGAVIAIVVLLGMGFAGIFPAQSGENIRQYLLSRPEILAEVSTAYQIKQETEDQKRRQAVSEKVHNKRLFDPDVAFVTGPADAKHTLVQFYDYNCPYCRQSTPAIQQYYEKHKNDTRFAFIEFPVKGPHSVTASRAAVAIARTEPDKYLAFHFTLMGQNEVADENLIFAVASAVGLNVEKLKSAMKDSAIDRVLNASHDLAKDVGVDGTPTFIVDGQIRPGLIDTETLNQLRKKS